MHISGELGCTSRSRLGTGNDGHGTARIEHTGLGHHDLLFNDTARRDHDFSPWAPSLRSVTLDFFDNV
jgi:hypothetical protein